MAPTTNLGINGLHVRGDYLFYDNLAQGTFNKIPVDLRTGKATGPAVTLLNSTSFVGSDDWTFDFEGNAWVVNGASNDLSLLPRAAYGTADSVSAEAVAGNTSPQVVLGPTSAQFGIRAEDLARGSLYISSNGGVPQYIGKNWTMGGAISRVDVGSLQV